MRREEVPQDESPFYHGHRRACYAIGPDGRYVVATSSGWSAERIATAQALADLENQVEAVRRDAIAGRASPLAYHMATRQMSPRLLASNAGTWTWRVRRHLTPAGFARLGPRALARYADALGLPVEELTRVPPAPRRVFTDEDLPGAGSAESAERGQRTDPGKRDDASRHGEADPAL